MSLKKPADIPRLPKTRSKNPDAARKAIPQKKEDKVEYICSAAFIYDTMFKKQYYRLRLETLAEFTSFAYEISVDWHVEKNVIDITIMGLQTKMNYLPKIEHAKADVLLENLFGEYTVNVIKQDGCINSAVYDFNIFKKQIELKNKFMPPKKNNRLFCEFEVAGESFSFEAE